MQTVKLPSGEEVVALGQGTWHMAERSSKRADEIAALQAGIDLGMTLIDTAEMYADGGAEKLLGEAIKGRRDKLFIVSKVYPWNASRDGTITACEKSLKRMGIDTIDLYLLHWRGNYPLAETIEAFEALQKAGKIRHWGVSNLDADDMKELLRTPGGDKCATNQVLYNLTRRGIEYDLLPWCQQRNISMMAYSPIEQGYLTAEPTVQAIAERHGATASQIALAWVLRQDGVIAIPKAGTVAHVQENFGALNIKLTEEDLAELDEAFPPPEGPQPLEVL
jgi:diketogulonate reductase-like aldo/keto reductase